VGKATLGFAGGPAIVFRIDPDAIQWNFEVLTSVTETIGGRVIQVIGSHLDDMVVTGSFGQDHSTPQGESWRQAEAFLAMIQKIMDYQASDATQQLEMHPPAVFTYPPLNWRFNVYVKDLSDADNPGSSIVLTPGKFNQRYQLTLFIVQDASTKLVQAGESNGIIDKQAQAAINAYMARISDGIGWKFSQYTGLANSTQLNNDIAAELALNPQAYDLPGGASASGTGTSSGSSGATPVDSSEKAFISAVLADMGAPATTANVNSIAAWFPHEFPSWPPSAQFNPMATTQQMPGSTQYNSAGVQNYPDAKTGATATAQTLTNGKYPNIVKALRAGTGICGGGFASEFSTWSNGGYTSVC
jgi:hypothetical protein